MASYNRPRSPPRRYGPDPRASTGTMIASSFDTRPRYDRLYEAQPVARQNYVDNGLDRGTTSRTQYVVRPRNNSLAEENRENRRPSNIIPIDSRNRPIVTNTGRERPRSPPPKTQRPRENTDRFLQPYAAGGRQDVARQDFHHQRHHSATPADMDRLVVANRGGRERGGYYRQTPSGQKVYPASRPAIRLDDGYSYTGPREQFERDYPVQVPQRRESQVRRERPVSALDFPDFKPQVASRRDVPPPSAGSRQFDKIERSDPSRANIRSGAAGDFGRLDELPRRHNSVRNPVVHQNRDDGYPAPRDDFDTKHSSKHAKGRHEDEDYPRAREPAIGRDTRTAEPRRQQWSRENSPDRLRTTVPGPDARRLPRSRESSPERTVGKGLAPPLHDSRRKPRSREGSPERSGVGKGLAAVGLGGIAAGLAKGLVKDSRENEDDSDSAGRSERRRRRRLEKEKERERREGIDTNAGASLPRDAPSPRREDVDRSDSDSQENYHKSHRRHRRRHRSDKEQQVQDNSAEIDADRTLPPGSQELTTEEMRGPEEDSDKRRRKRLEYHSRDNDVPDRSLETRTMSPGENEDDRPRRVQLVEPVKDKEQEVKPKGILKPARQVPFPEDPHPTREGVAPLKEPGKESVPVEARWTKISRMLVNPEALKQARERFEERDDYVIVLRVISKEDIAKLAEKTREIREARELEWQEELERRKREETNYRSRRDTSDEDEEEDEEQKARPLIGSPPQYPPGQATQHDPRAYQKSEQLAPVDPRAYQTSAPPGPIDPRAYQASGQPASNDPRAYQTSAPSGPIDPRAYQASGQPASNDPRAYHGSGQPTPIDPRIYQTAQDPLGRSMPDLPVTPIVNVVPESYSSNV